MDDLALTPAALAPLKGARVLVTGDTGFKGSWLSYWLWQLGARVTGFALPPKTPRDHYRLLNLQKKIRHVDGDVRDFAAVHDAVRRARPEFVFHLAAQSLVRASVADPKTTFDTNVGGTVNVLESVRRTPDVRVLVAVTSDKCYRNNEWVWGYRENDALGGGDPYSGSKAAAEMAFAAYRETYFMERPGLGSATVRAGNVLGGGDWSADRVVPDCVRALEAGRAVEVRHPRATRPWQHVLEPLSGYLTLALALRREPGRYGGSWNFGPDGGAAHPVIDLVERFLHGWGSGRARVARVKKNAHETTLLALNSDKARRELGWRTRWGFERTVRETVNWYRGVRSGQSAEALTAAQIRSYLESAGDS